MYKIFGRNKFYQVENYGEFKDQKECLEYFQKLKRSTALDNVRLDFIECNSNFDQEFCEGCWNGCRVTSDDGHFIHCNYFQQAMFPKSCNRKIYRRNFDE